MNYNDILATNARALVASPKGILAIDESTETCTKRFEKLGIPSTLETRRAYREMIITTPDIEHYVSGMIMVEETFNQTTADQKSFLELFKEKGMLPGIKVDQGLEVYKGKEKITKGLDGLADRLQKYKNDGAVFAKWRAVFRISDTTPTDELIAENTIRLTRYAKQCQEVGLVPIVEPEILMDGNHDIERTEKIVSDILDVLFVRLNQAEVYLPGLLLKTGLVEPGIDAPKESVEKVAEMTIRCFVDYVPNTIGGIILLSGGLDAESVNSYLNAMHTEKLPWPLTFSFGRAIQNDALTLWASDMTKVKEAQALLLQRAQESSAASIGKYGQ